MRTFKYLTICLFLILSTTSFAQVGKGPIGGGGGSTGTGVTDGDKGGVTVSALGTIWTVDNDSHSHTSATISGIDISADTNLTAGDGVTLNGDDIDFDGGASPAGDLGGTWANPSVDDDSHNHTDATISDTITVGASGSVNDAAIPAVVTRDTEWDSLAEFNAATTDADALSTTGSADDLSGVSSGAQPLDSDLTDLAEGIMSFFSNPLSTTVGLTPVDGKIYCFDNESANGDPCTVDINGTVDYIALWDGTSYKAIMDKDGNVLFASIDLGGGTFDLPNSTADVALADAGKVHLNTTDEQLSFHSAADGQISGEVALSLLDHIVWSGDPGAAYDSDAEWGLMTVGIDYPEGIHIVKWTCDCNVADPDVEINADLRYADDWGTLANAADIDEIDTTTGSSSEDTDANINGGAAVATGKVIYIGNDGDPEGTCTQMVFEMWFYGEED